MNAFCPHFPDCGGCQFQSDNAEEERARKTAIANAAFAKHGQSFRIDEFWQAPLASRRRASLSARRTKKSVQLGFNQAKSHQVIDIESCAVLSPAIMARLPLLRTLTPKLASRSAQIKFHITECANGFDLVIENAKEIDAFAQSELARECSAHHIRRLIINDRQIYQDDEPLVAIGDDLVTTPPHPFLQASQAAETKLRALAHHGLAGAKRVADLFCGIGTFCYGLDAETHGYEGERALVDAMARNINRLRYHHASAIERDLFRDPLTAKELADFDGVIIDPPRAGAKAQCHQLAQSAVPRIAYISCAPESFARDAGILTSADNPAPYAIERLILIDQFRFSDHVELFALLKKSA